MTQDQSTPQELTAYESVERNAKALMANDMARLMADLTPEAFAKAMQMMGQQAGQAQPQITGYEIEDKGTDGEDHLFHVTYKAAEGQLTLFGRWRKIGPDWKIVDFGPIEGQAAQEAPPSA